MYVIRRDIQNEMRDKSLRESSASEARSALFALLESAVPFRFLFAIDADDGVCGAGGGTC